MEGDSDPADDTGDQGGTGDREYGMYRDPLVMKRSRVVEEGLQREIKLRLDERRLGQVYEFIHKYRPGTPTGIRRMTRGSYNAIFGLDYTDGSAILRIPVPGNTAFPDEKVRAEVATLRYIEKMTSIPVPHIYHWGTAAENPLGLGPFIIMDHIPHTQTLDDVLRDPTPEDKFESYLDPNIPKEKLERMSRQVANIILQLSRVEMPKIGSLQLH
jgi:aminoglycoside phosphotransferase (APT) family kinase protein